MIERVSLQPAYVLHARPYRDTSALLEVFTAEHGRFTVVAKGARRSGRKRGGGVPQPFVPILISFSGRAELKTLTGSESAGAPLALHGERLYSGLYLNELLVRLLHRHDPHPQLFASYGGALEALAAQSTPLDGILRGFELELLEEMGYRIQFAVEAQTNAAIDPLGLYRYEPATGFSPCMQTQQPQPECYAGEDLLAMSRGEFDGPARNAARRLLRQALSVHLGDRPLNSRALFRRTVMAGATPGPNSTEPSGTEGTL